MLRFWLKPTLIILLGLALAALAARALGSTQPPHPALAGFTTGCENIPQPCWYGIVPGVTTVEESTVVMESLLQSNTEASAETLSDTSEITVLSGHSTSDFRCHIHADSISADIVHSVVLFCDNLRLGELINTLGMPQSIIFFHQFGSRSKRIDFRETFVYLDYDFASLNAFLKISRVVIPVSLDQEQLPLAYNWRGYVPIWIYCPGMPLELAC